MIVNEQKGITKTTSTSWQRAKNKIEVIENPKEYIDEVKLCLFLNEITFMAALNFPIYILFTRRNVILYIMLVALFIIPLGRLFYEICRLLESRTFIFGLEQGNYEIIEDVQDIKWSSFSNVFKIKIAKNTYTTNVCFGSFSSLYLKVKRDFYEEAKKLRHLKDKESKEKLKVLYKEYDQKIKGARYRVAMNKATLIKVEVEKGGKKYKKYDLLFS